MQELGLHQEEPQDIRQNLGTLKGLEIPLAFYMVLKRKKQRLKMQTKGIIKKEEKLRRGGCLQVTETFN